MGGKTWNPGHGVSCSMPAALLIHGAVENYSWFIIIIFSPELELDLGTVSAPG